MPSLRVSLFGKLTLQFGDTDPCLLHGQRGQELFAYLLLNTGRAVLREVLATALWRDGDACQPRKQLRQTLWHLQRELDTVLPSTELPLLVVEPNWIQTNPAVNLWLDVAVFREAFEEAVHVPGRKLDAATARILREALHLYQGDFLDGCYHDWCLNERERLQQMHQEMLAKLMAYCEANHEYQEGLAHGSRLMHYDRASERTHRGLMRLYYLSGNRSAALRQYKQCVAILAEELGATPARQTVTLYERIRDEPIGGSPTQLTVTETPTDTTAAPLLGLIHQLQQLQSSLSDLQRQVQKALQTGERLRASQLDGPSDPF
jgi:DNA-binding SARP family transcriptional activator